MHPHPSDSRPGGGRGPPVPPSDGETPLEWPFFSYLSDIYRVGTERIGLSVDRGYTFSAPFFFNLVGILYFSDFFFNHF